jgi:hypothetical protein
MVADFVMVCGRKEKGCCNRVWRGSVVVMVEGGLNGELLTEERNQGESWRDEDEEFVGELNFLAICSL